MTAFKWLRDGIDKVPTCLLIVGERLETEQVAAAVMKQRGDGGSKIAREKELFHDN